MHLIAVEVFKDGYSAEKSDRSLDAKRSKKLSPSPPYEYSSKSEKF